MGTSGSCRSSLSLAAIHLLLGAGMALGGETPASEDPCAAWVLEGYRIGMPAAEAMAVRPVKEKRYARSEVVQYLSEPEPGHFKSVAFELSPDGRVRYVKVVLESARKSEVREQAATLTARLGPPGIENAAPAGWLEPLRVTRWTSVFCDSEIALRFTPSISVYRAASIEMGPTLGVNPSTRVEADPGVKVEVGSGTNVTSGRGGDVFPGFSIAPPAGPDWRRGPISPSRRGSTLGGETMDVFYIRNPTPDGQTVYASAIGAVLPIDPDSPAAADPRAAAVESALKIADTRRFKLLSSSHAPDPQRPGNCTRYVQETMDRKAAGSKEPLLLTLHGLLCSHPDFPDYLVHAMWSQRGPEGAARVDVSAAREAFFRDLVLEPFGATVRTIRVPMSYYAAISGGTAWIPSEPGKLIRLDVETGQAVATLPVGDAPRGVSTTEGAVWVADFEDGTLTRVDPSRNAVTATIKVRKSPNFVLADRGAVWVSHMDADRVSRIDPETGKTLAEIKVGRGPWGLVACAGSIFAANQLGGSLSRIDPSTNLVTATFEVGKGPGLSTCYGDSIWVTLGAEDCVAKVDPSTGAVLARYPTGRGPLGIAAYQGLLWVVNTYDATLSVLDPETGKTVRGPIPAGSQPRDVIAAGPELWITDPGAGAVYRLRGSRAAP